MVTALRPATVTCGVTCMGVSLLIGVAILYLAWREPRIAGVCLVVVGVLTAWALRSGWPRWAIAVIAVTSLALTYPLVLFQFSYGTLIPVATGLQLTLELVGFVLLFHPRSSRWYRRPLVATHEEPHG